jgi:hypothetical protein
MWLVGLKNNNIIQLNMEGGLDREYVRYSNGIYLLFILLAYSA